MLLSSFLGKMFAFVQKRLVDVLNKLSLFIFNFFYVKWYSIEKIQTYVNLPMKKRNMHILAVALLPIEDAINNPYK